METLGAIGALSSSQTKPAISVRVSAQGATAPAIAIPVLGPCLGVRQPRDRGAEQDRPSILQNRGRHDERRRLLVIKDTEIVAGLAVVIEHGDGVALDQIPHRVGDIPHIDRAKGLSRERLEACPIDDEVRGGHPVGAGVGRDQHRHFDVHGVSQQTADNPEGRAAGDEGGIEPGSEPFDLGVLHPERVREVVAAREPFGIVGTRIERDVILEGDIEVFVLEDAAAEEVPHREAVEDAERRGQIRGDAEGAQPPEGKTGLAAVDFVVAELGQGSGIPVALAIRPGQGRVGAWRERDAEGPEVRKEELEPVAGVWSIAENVGGDVVAHAVERPAEVEAGAFPPFGLASAGPKGPHGEVVDDVVGGFLSVLEHERGAVGVVDDVVLHEPERGVVHGDAPFWRAVHGVADQLELTTRRRRGGGANVVVQMQRIAADLIRSRGQRLRRQMRVFGRRRGELQRGEPGERGRVEGGDRRAAEILEQHVAEIDRSPMNEDRVAADAGRVRRAHDDAAAKIAHMREEAHHTVRIARTWMAVGERSGQRNDAAADRLYGPFFPPRLPPREIGPVGVGHLPGIGHDQAVPSRPPAQIARHRHGRAAGGQFPRETQKRRGAGLADHRDFAECDEAVSGTVRDRPPY